MRRLVDFVRGPPGAAARPSGACRRPTPTWTDEALDPDALTICFARRFATYKRANLLLSQPERLLALLRHPERPVQFVFAGKAHPADDAGKELIRQIVHVLPRRRGPPPLRLPRRLRHGRRPRRCYQGADVWLNTPRRPLEACGTSGMKAALNGALNCSILDGWWAEWFNGDNGWAITSAESIEDLERRDELEAESLFGLLESQIVPAVLRARRRRHPPRLDRAGVQRLADARAARHRGPHGARLHHPALRAAGRAGHGAVGRHRPPGP